MPAVAFQRHFLALEPDESARAALASLPLPEGVRRVDAADLHLTLAFLDTLDAEGEARAREAAAGMAATMAAAPPGGRTPEVVLDAVEYWRRPGILCAVAAARPDPLEALAAVAAAALRSFDFPVDERPFRSHVTLARKAPRGSAAHAPLAIPIRWAAREIALMASTGGQGSGARYTVLARVPISVPTQ